MVSSIRHSVLFIDPEDQVRAEVSMGDVWGEGVWLHDTGKKLVKFPEMRYKEI